MTGTWRHEWEVTGEEGVVEGGWQSGKQLRAQFCGPQGVET